MAMVFCLSACICLIKAPTRGPVAPTNRVRKVVTKLAKPMPILPSAILGSVGPQHKKRINPEISRYMVAGDKVISTNIPMMEPIIAPGKKEAITFQSMNRQLIPARPALEPSWMMPCIGITNCGGITCAIIPSINMPPPAPRLAVSSEVKKAVITSEMNTNSDKVNKIISIITSYNRWSFWH